MQLWYKNPPVLAHQDVIITLSDNVDNYEMFFIRYRYSATGYNYDREFYRADTYWVCPAEISAAGAVYSALTHSGNLLTVTANGSTSGVYMVAVYGKKAFS